MAEETWTQTGQGLNHSPVAILVQLFNLTAFAGGQPVYNCQGALLGAIGVTATPLRPAGKVRFGDDFIDVIAEGSYVMPGTRVQVVEIEGNRVVVKEV